MTIYLVSTFYPKLNHAKKIAKLVVKNKLAACVNINKNINSIFIWRSKMLDEKEIELNFKTTEKKVKKLDWKIKLKNRVEKLSCWKKWVGLKLKSLVIRQPWPNLKGIDSISDGQKGPTNIQN